MTLSEHFLFKEVSPVLCHVRCPCFALVDTRPVSPSSTCAPLTLQQSLVRHCMEENTVQCVGLIIIVQTLPCVSQMCSLLEHFLNNCQPQVGLSTVISVLCAVSCTVSCVLCHVCSLLCCVLCSPINVLCTTWLLVSKLRGVG